MKYILAKKLGMTTIYNDGVAKNVTLLEAGKNVVTQIRTAEKDGYTALQIGLVKVDAKEGDKKSKAKYYEKKEIRMETVGDFNISHEFKVEQFEINEKVQVIGVSKGKGYQGVVKRHGFAGAPASHGHRHDLRAPGSIGCAFPERVFPGKRMAGRMGGTQVTAKSLKVALVDPEKKMIAVEGAVPGNNGGVVQIIKHD